MVRIRVLDCHFITGILVGILGGIIPGITGMMKIVSGIDRLRCGLKGVILYYTGHSTVEFKWGATKGRQATVVDVRGATVQKTAWERHSCP